MKLIVSLSLIDAIKDELRQSLPEVKSSHRTEALARGLGWATNAAMRASLTSGVSERAALPGLFTDYLAQRGVEIASRALRDAVLRVQIRGVMAVHEQLTHHGFGVHEGDRISVTEWQKRYARSRAEMLEPPAIAQFERACEFLARLETTCAPTRVLGSYRLKHSAERWHRHRGADPDYVSNGMLLAAAYHLGLQVRRASRTAFTGYLNVSTASVRALEAERKPPLPQPEPGEPFRVLGKQYTQHGPYGFREGRFCYLPAGEAKAIRLRVSEHTPKHLLQLAPLDYWTAKFPPSSRRAPFDTQAAVDELFTRAGEAGLFDLDQFRQTS